MGSSRPSEAKGQVLAEESVLVNVVTPYMSVRFLLTELDLRIEWPHAFLGILPVRESSLDVPIAELHSIRMTHVLMPNRLLLAGMIAATPFLFELPHFLVGVAAVLAFWFLPLGLVGAVQIYHSRGRSTIPVCLLQKRTTQKFIDAVWRAMSASGGVNA